MKIKSTLKLTTLALLAVLTLNAQGTILRTNPITYQGQLYNNGSPANGSYTLIFNLFTNDTGGNALGVAATNSNVAVNNGLFTTIFDGNRFGDFTNPPMPWPSPSWLELAVATNGANAFTTLTPRQQLTSVPVSIYAETAGVAASAAQLSGTVANSQLASDFITVNPGSGLSGGGTVVLGNSIALSNAGVLSVTAASPLSSSGGQRAGEGARQFRVDRVGHGQDLQP